MTPPLIHDLCERYERNRDSYRSDNYNEAQARQEFINPLFKLLGWDMDNEQGYAEAYKDVVHEDAIRIGGALKAPDYSFRIGGQRKFFLEAKKPQVSVVDQKDPAYQIRRYAWNAKLPHSILTNFSELAVYDCRYRPEIGDAAAKHRVEYFTYEKYADKWEYLVNTFSREAILKGSFDKYAQGMKGKRGTQEVDSEFLKEIEVWRDILAKNLKLRNKDLTIEALNFSVGRIIDRIIFLRICEDRGIEEYGQLEKLLKGAGVYEQLTKLFRRADERYNSGLFHFQKEKGRGEQPDTLTLGLTVDDKILKDVVRTLYYPQSPYEFRVFPADILGQVYEQFLGKVIVKTGRSVEVEEKPEVRKAGGVYYTPTYIVDYIVKHTVGKLVENKTPEEVSKLRVLDPACGSGSFLIGAYQYLLDWHLAQYTQTPSPNPFPVNGEGESESDSALPSSVHGGRAGDGGLESGEAEQKKNRWKSIPKMHWQYAREMRKEATDAEKLLWKSLEKDKLGISFRRQHPIGPFIVDFFASSIGLVIEVDGGVHLPDDAKEYDAHRDERMQQVDLTVLRFTNEDVLNRLEWVLDEIRKQTQTPTPNPFPVNGEGESESDSALPSSVHGGRAGDGGLRQVSSVHGGRKGVRILPIYETPAGYRLTLAERKRILLNNIYGVDIDGQAVEVTKLSLLLKVLEGANAAEVQGELSLRHHALPDLSSNIKCGNSLVGTDILKSDPPSPFTGKGLGDGVSVHGGRAGDGGLEKAARGGLSPEDIARINPFDWQSEFKEIFKHGGFDAVIGNPPYLNVDDTWGKGDARLAYLKIAYSEIYNDKTDILFYFLKQAISISKDKASFIVSRAFMEAYKADKLRSWILNNTKIQEIVDLQNFPVFKGIGITTAIVAFSKQNESTHVRVRKLLDTDNSQPTVNLYNDSLFESVSTEVGSLTSEPWSFTNETQSKLFKKIDHAGKALGEIVTIGQGMQTGANNAFGELTDEDIAKMKVPVRQWVKRARNSDIQRFVIEDSGERLLYLEGVWTAPHFLESVST